MSPAAAYLAAAITVEVAATSMIASTHGFSKPLPTVVVLALYGLSFVFLAQAVPAIPVGIDYAIWSGVGTVAILLISVALGRETLDVLKALGVLLVVAGVVLLNLAGSETA